MKRIITLVSGLGLMALAGMSYGQDMPAMADLDADQDGQISAEEASANETVAAAFSEADADSDGMLSADEYAALAGQ